MDSMSQRYRQASKAPKTRILDKVCAATGFHRKYAITQINLVETVRPAKAARPRRPKNSTSEWTSFRVRPKAEAGYRTIADMTAKIRMTDILKYLILLPCI